MEEDLKGVENEEHKYSYCIIKQYWAGLNFCPFAELEEGTKIFNMVENNEVEFVINVIGTTDYNQANKFKILDAHYIASHLKEGTTLKYVY